MTDEQKIQAIRDYIKAHSEDELLYSDAPAMLEDLKLILGEEEVVPPDYVGWHRREALRQIGMELPSFASLSPKEFRKTLPDYNPGEEGE